MSRNGSCQSHATKGLTIVAAFAAMLGWSAVVEGQSVRQYTANYTTNTIVADGVDTPGEWDGASTGGGDWNEIRQAFGDLSTDGDEFRMLWDDTNVYIRWENTFTDWLDADTTNTNPNVDFGVETLNIYLDPNNDALSEANDVPDGEVDGYQFAPNIVRNSVAPGTPIVSTNADRGGVGMYTEAHVDAIFGSNGLWGGDPAPAPVEGLGMANGIVVGSDNQNAGDPNPGAFMEIVWPWAAFDAAAEILIDGTMPELGTKTTGLNATAGVQNGDVWFANFGMINNATPDNFLPAWNWTTSNYFSSHGNQNGPGGHGEILFDNKPVTETPGDFDASGMVGNGDLTLLLDGWGGAPDAGWVIDVPTSVGNDSLTILLDNWGNDYTPQLGAVGVPEPSCLAIALLATMSGLALRRRS